jgi:hypothetical protein
MGFLDENYQYRPQPAFNSTFEKEKYVDRETTRWVDGFQGLSGLHYFHLSEGMILSGQFGLIHPVYRDGDEFLFDAFLECSKERKNMLELKWRGFGFSSCIGTILAYNSQVYKGCTQIITAPNNRKIEIIRKQKLLPILRNLQKEKFLPNNIYDAKSEVIELTSDRKKDQEVSVFKFMETASDLEAVQKIEGERARLVVLDEWFDHNRAEDVLLSAEGATTEAGDKFGIILMGGSCNNINTRGGQRLLEMINTAKARNVKIHITPASICRYGCIDEGRSNIEKATREIKERCQKLKDSGDYRAYFNYKKEHFLSLNDILDSSIGKNISDDLHDKIKSGRQLAYTLNINPCALRWTPQGIYTDKDDKGCIYIYNAPAQGHIYIAGCDPIPGTSDNPEGSDFVIVIKDITNNQYVAYYAERCNDIQKMYGRLKMLLSYYKSNLFPNGACCMIERNQIAGIEAIAKERNEWYLLASDPKNPKVKGYHKAPNMKPSWDERLDAILFNYINRNDVPFVRFYEELDIMGRTSNGKKINTDFIDAIKSCEYYHSFFTNLQDLEVMEEKKRFFIETRNGNTYTTWK